MHHHEKQNSILSFWFGDRALNPLANQKLWYAKKPEFDAEIRERFERLLLEAETGAFDDWAKTPDGALAFVVLCDQFPRNIYRGTDRSFDFDRRALKASQIALAHRFDEKMSVPERLFLYMPFEHSEDRDQQKRAIELFEKLVEDAVGDEKTYVSQSLEWARKHFAVIERFGRFPHRNEALGRTSTQEEREFLKRPGSAF